jgi:hypothetical protein
VIPWSWHANPRPTPISPLIPLPPETQGDWFFLSREDFFLEKQGSKPRVHFYWSLMHQNKYPDLFFFTNHQHFIQAHRPVLSHKPKQTRSLTNKHQGARWKQPQTNNITTPD